MHEEKKHNRKTSQCTQQYSTKAMTMISLNNILDRAGGSALWSWITVVCVALSSNLVTVEAFTSSLPPALQLQTSIQQHHSLATCLFESSAPTESAATSYEALSQAEISAILDAVPVYAVTSADGLVPLKEPGNDHEIAYFFFQAEMANAVYAPLKKEGSEWTVKGFPLGVIWYDLLQNPAANNNNNNPTIVNGVEYRLVPDTRELQGARNILQQSNQTTTLFASAYNEIPIFMDQFLRLSVNGQEDERAPLYLGLQDLIRTCQQAVDQSSGEYQAVITILDLHSLVAKMQQPSDSVNFREATLIPPTPRAMEKDELVSSSDENGSSAQATPPTSMEEMDLPTATNSWDD